MNCLACSKAVKYKSISDAQRLFYHFHIMFRLNIVHNYNASVMNLVPNHSTSREKQIKRQKTLIALQKKTRARSLLYSFAFVREALLIVAKNTTTVHS